MISLFAGVQTFRDWIISLLVCIWNLIKWYYCWCAIIHLLNVFVATMQKYNYWMDFLLMCITYFIELFCCSCAIAILLSPFFAGVQPRVYWKDFLLVCNYYISWVYRFVYSLLVINFLLMCILPFIEKYPCLCAYVLLLN